MSIQFKEESNFAKNVNVYTGELKRLTNEALSKFNLWQESKQGYRKDRKAIKDLLNLSDHQLRDIGISRSDVIWASHLPKGRVATRELQTIAKSQKY